MTRRDDIAVESARAEWDFEQVRDDGQPSPWAHARYIKAARDEFSPLERHRIRAALGMLEDQ